LTRNGLSAAAVLYKGEQSPKAEFRLATAKEPLGSSSAISDAEFTAIIMAIELVERHSPGIFGRIIIFSDNQYCPKYAR
jgi:hypothetical protein